MFFGKVLTTSDKKETSLTFDGNETCKADDKITDIGGDIDDIFYSNMISLLHAAN